MAPFSQVTTIKFWFATGGAGFCLSRGLALKMSPWARWVGVCCPGWEAGAGAAGD